MFMRQSTQTAPTEATEAIAPEVDDDPTPRWQRPSSFASRKPQADANNALLGQRRLVSLGKSDYWERDFKGTGRDTYTEVEMFMDLDNPTHMYVEFPDRLGLHPLFDTSGRTDETVEIGTIRQGLRFQGSHMPSAEAPAPRPV